MKRKLRVGVCFAQFICTFRLARPRYNSLLAVLTIMCLYAHAQSLEGSGAAALGFLPDTITPLQIGDTIPEYLWHLPLQVVNHPEGRDTITLNDFRCKAILLDFLSTGCSGCIAAIPKLEAIRAEFGNEVSIIPITPQKRDRVAAFIPKNKYISGTRLPFVVEDKVLKKHFPHQYISHVIWIAAKGEIRAFTGSSHVTAGTFREFLSGNPLDWPVKTENTSFFNAPLIAFQKDASVLPNNAKRHLYYAMVTGHTEGVGPYVATKEDSLMNVYRVSFRNRSLYELYKIALDDEFPPSTKIDVALDGFYYAHERAAEENMTRAEWGRRYERCYERVVPLGTTEAAWKKMMLADLNHFLGLNGRIEWRGKERFFVLTKK